MAALLMVVVTVVALVHGLDDQSAPFPSVDTITSNGSANDAAAPKAGPLELALNAEISEALKTKEWPGLEPSVESVISGPEADPEVRTNCGGTLFPDQALCRWGSKDAPTLVVIVGDSVALSYAGPLRRIALDSDNQIQVRAEAMPGCEFTDDLIAYDDQRLVDACTARKQHSIDVINAKQPAIVIIANSYGEKQVVGHDKPMTPREWFESMKRIVAKFKGSTKKIVLLAAPPGDVSIDRCYRAGDSRPADCVGRVSKQWSDTAYNERRIAESVGGAWMDSRQWFCNQSRQCPSFVGQTLTKRDGVHMAPSYGDKIFPVMSEAFKSAGIL
ncbi:hypothetical protein H7J06_26995 [Mycobacterium hodleri]|uniref:SGNH hydrolase domain-containing protein n=1 Tax=Mycolicibacterium hodleri TaxID=49897 RepID=UPI0021F377A2|nr:SGNH hydrolase domain-containing protein [Mycolicibacterium hodleri]MCV7136619.1 hypothetical protein [Mycolicibacterium hodleri]